MFEKHILCNTCGRTYAINKKIFRCERCGGSLELVFNYKKMKITKNLLRSRTFNHMRYCELYPIRKAISIQEGGTPLIRSNNLEKMFRLNFQLWFKNECSNPSGSFKDRGSSIEIAKAKEFREKKVVCASTGNMGASVSAYSGIANLECYIFTPEDAVPVKLEQILGYGAKLYKISGSYSQAERLVREANKNYGIYLLGDYLYRREGTKSVGFEIMDQLDFRTKNLWIVSPVGNGTLISAIWKAVKEFETLGLIRDKPKLVGIQAEGCNPVVKAFRDGKNVKPAKRPRTLAVAIECGDPLDGERALASVKESGGFIESVSDGEILKARELLARNEGLFAEPAGAVSLAGLIKIKKRIKPKGRVVCIVTGHGLKTPKTNVTGREIRIRADPEALREIFG